jgi:peroxiredoxin
MIQQQSYQRGFRRLLIGLLLMAACTLAGDSPRVSPEYVIYLPEGGNIRLSKLKGKVVLLEFLRTTCPYCQRTAKTISKIYEDLGPKGFQPIGVAMDDMPSVVVSPFVEEQQLRYIIGYAHSDTAIAYLARDSRAPLMVPQLVIIDRQGMIRREIVPDAKFLENEEKNLRTIIEDLLKEPYIAKDSTKDSK